MPHFALQQISPKAPAKGAMAFHFASLYCFRGIPLAKPRTGAFCEK
jgi:hypothetical protein